MEDKCDLFMIGSGEHSMIGDFTTMQDVDLWLDKLSDEELAETVTDEFHYPYNRVITMDEVDKELKKVKWKPCLAVRKSWWYFAKEIVLKQFQKSCYGYSILPTFQDMIYFNQGYHNEITKDETNEKRKVFRLN